MANRIGDRDPEINLGQMIESLMYIVEYLNIHLADMVRKKKEENGKYKNGKIKYKTIMVDDLDKPKFKSIDIKPGD